MRRADKIGQVVKFTCPENRNGNLRHTGGDNGLEIRDFLTPDVSSFVI